MDASHPYSENVNLDPRLHSLTTPDEVAAVMEPIDRARTLPAPAFISDAWLELERERVFERNWVAALFACEVENSGDVHPFSILGVPMVAVCGADSVVRVFHNIVPYDGSLAVMHPGHGLQEISTLYHGMQFDLSGRLTAAPFWDTRPDCGPEGLTPWNGDLIEVRSAVRFGIVFVNVDGQADGVDDWLEPWSRVVSRDYAIDRLVPARDVNGKPLILRRTVAANWKTYLENASINLLHEAFTHAIYRKSPEVPRVESDGTPRFDLFVDGALIAFSHNRQKSGKTYDPVHLPTAGHDTSRQPDHGYFTTVYPNLNVPFLDAYAKVNIALPLAPGVTALQHLRFYSTEALADPRFQEQEAAVNRTFNIFHQEDQVAIESVQAGRKSPVWRQHFYAPFWDSLHHRLDQLVMRDMMRTERG